MVAKDFQGIQTLQTLAYVKVWLSALHRQGDVSLVTLVRQGLCLGNPCLQNSFTTHSTKPTFYMIYTVGISWWLFVAD